jgi:glycosyltransferase involved in cell wall biosynthesis
MMTASLVPGDAIGNYILTLKRILEELGFRVSLYADHVAPAYGHIARLSEDYHPSGGILWYHYSIYADNLALVQSPVDYRIMDFQSVSPPRLFKGYDAHLTQLCQRGIEVLPTFRDHFDLCIVHSEYTRVELLAHGYRRVEKVPMVVDRKRFDGREDEALSRWLKALNYMLFVGRIVPQKDILGMLEIFARLHARRPDVTLILVGGRHLAPGYQRRIDATVDRLGLNARVLLTGQISDPSMLTSLYRHARFTIITSEWESFCVPVVESMTFGTPIVAHNIPPLPEVLGDAGVLINKQDQDATAATIDTLWDDAAAYGRLQRACVQRTPLFTAPALRCNLLRVFQRVFANG